MILGYDGISGYKTWNWNLYSASNQVVLEEFEGAYTAAKGSFTWEQDLAGWTSLHQPKRRSSIIYNYNG